MDARVRPEGGKSSVSVMIVSAVSGAGTNGTGTQRTGVRRGRPMRRAASFTALRTNAEVWIEDEDGTLTPETDDEDPDETPEHSSKEQLPPLPVRTRFHSSDVVIRTASGTYLTSGGEVDSPTLALRQWIATGVAASCSPAQLMRHRQRRRAQSSDVPSKTNNSSVLGGLKDRLVRRSWDHGIPVYHNAIQEEISHEDHSEDHHEEDLDSESDIGSESEVEETRSRRADSEDSNASSICSYYSNTVGQAYGSPVREDPASVEKLRNLQKLYQEGFITVTEYKNRRLQLVDELTVTDKTIHRATDLIRTDLPVVHRDPPDFTLLRERDAIKHVFDSEKRKWTSSRIKVKIDPQPFARGGLRQVFHLQDLSVIPRLGPEGRPVSYVAKIAIDVNEDPDTYFRDVEMQAVASKFAKLYNSYNPPRRVEFLNAWILQLVPSGNASGEDDNLTMRGTICGVEPYIAGEYHKHNNNFGYVSDLERNTPQAFSHFTYEASGREMLIVDIQGVADHYTDPQIHTRSGKEFGKGNLAVRGFERFLESHRCNPICRYLKLQLNNPKDENGVATEAQNTGRIDPKGTVPAQTYMSQPSIRVKRVDSELCHYYGDSKAFKKYQAKHQHHVDNSDDATSAFVAALKEQRNCSSFCGVGLCTIS